MERFIKMNEIFVCRSTYLLKTVVGSCIALCLWDNNSRVGGMGHIMLPESNGDRTAPPGKYADTAVNALVSKMVHEGASVNKMVAMCVGGASMFQNHKAKLDAVGIRNFAVVRKELERLEIPVVTEAVGGSMGRKVTMDCSDGIISISMLLKNR